MESVGLYACRSVPDYLVTTVKAQWEASIPSATVRLRTLLLMLNVGPGPVELQSASIKRPDRFARLGLQSCDRKALASSR